MDNSNNNIRLEIELTNRERGDSVIRDDIETALEIHIKKNETIKVNDNPPQAPVSTQTKPKAPPEIK